MTEPTIEVVAMSQMFESTWRDRIRRRLFPYRHCHLPEAPADYADCITIHTEVGLSWLDRLRVVVSGRLEVSTKTVTKNVVGENITASESYVLPPRFLERPQT